MVFSYNPMRHIALDRMKCCWHISMAIKINFYKLQLPFIFYYSDFRMSYLSSNSSSLSVNSISGSKHIDDLTHTRSSLYNVKYLLWSTSEVLSIKLKIELRQILCIFRKSATVLEIHQCVASMAFWFSSVMRVKWSVLLWKSIYDHTHKKIQNEKEEKEKPKMKKEEKDGDEGEAEAILFWCKC